MATQHTARSIAADVAAGQRTAREVCRAALERIVAVDPRVNAFITVNRERTLERAGAIDDRIAAGKRLGPLAGVPIAVKDNIATTFGHTTCGSKSLAGFVSPYDATVVRRIEAAGGVIVGKTNLDEFAMGSSNEHSAFGPTRNPWDLRRVPGGSSGGSAAAVAARIVPLALGSDTGGSIRLPAALCGVVGLKPSYGRVSRYGLVAFGSSLDQIGPLATNVEDAALLLGVISGRDPADSTSVDLAVPDYVGELAERKLEKLASGLRVGVPREYFGDGLDSETRAAVEAAIEVYRGLGASVVAISLPHTRYAIAAYYLIATAEASSNLARFDGVHYGHRAACGDIEELYAASRSEGLGAEVKRRILLGTFALSAGYHDAYYDKALRVRRLVRQDFDRAFEQCDLIAGPTAPTPAFKLGERLSDPLVMYLADVYTIATNLAGLPAMSVVCGFTASGLPIGLQLMAPIFHEVRLLQAARLYERQTDWHARQPDAAAPSAIS